MAEKEYTKKKVSKLLVKIGWLKIKDIQNHPNLPPLPIILDLFETSRINDVWRELGIPCQRPKPKYTKEDASKALKKTGWLSMRAIQEHPDLPTLDTISKLFKTTKINDVWEELGIELPKYSKEDVVEVLKETGWLSWRDIKKHPKLPGVPSILKLFKATKLNEVWSELGIEFPEGSTKKEIAAMLKKIGWLSARDIAAHPDLPSLPTILRAFGKTKINDVWKTLGIRAPLKQSSKKVKNTGAIKEKTKIIGVTLPVELHEEFKALAERKDRTVSQYIKRLIRKEVELGRKKALLEDDALFDLFKKHRIK